ncbi:transcription-repair coupling factor [Opitutus terrae]|uniref:Transcription-repair-coupling factor n=1 Tax=Opitutus terrae (strain DSM 11246 / JCM 15787 / PB90-1) TaxID=452637 RepID=B1ZYU7_OPITP|nr:transcription-repair coupling factor [Opitutus terrae]ACB76270.1 transcription-repair coupling factor [Opitutus terrae PB90-1]
MADPATRARHKLTGITPSAQGAVLTELTLRHPAPVWIVVAADLKAAERLAEDAAFFHGAAQLPHAQTTLVFPESMPDAGDMREAFAASNDRFTVLSKLRATRSLGVATSSEVGGARRRGGATALPPLVIVTTPGALLQPVPALEEFATREFTLSRGQTQSFQGLLERLQQLDYDSEAVCEAPGHYAIRGGIIDVYPVTANTPYRLDFFGDEIEAIREFDPVTQRSGATVESITISASSRVRLDPSKTGIADYLSPRTHLVLIEPAALEEKLSQLAREADGATGVPPVGLESAAVSPVHPLNALLGKCAAIFGVSDLDEAAALLEDADDDSTWDSESLSHHRHYPEDALVAQERLQVEEDARRRFLQQVAAWRQSGFAVFLVVSKEGEEQRIREILQEDAKLKRIQPQFLRGTLNEGFRITFRGANPSPPEAKPEETPPTLTWPSLPPKVRGLVVVTETEVFGRQRQRRPALNPRAMAQRAQIDQLLDFSELVEGDFVVHLQHGIAHYRGLTKLDTAQGVREVISLEFDDHVTLHVPLQESHLISRYVGLSKTKPQLGRIGSGRWEKARLAAERATIDLAAELLRIQAAREAQPGFAFPPDTTWQKEFEASFPFTETRDQLRAIEETKTDMERTQPMDRLICGDVGFGKTEVAIRAAFKAVQGGRQVAMLVPTTVLAQQHLNTFRERMAGYPIAIEMVSRFRSRADQKKILTATAAGQVDILIGTHRVLQHDVKFRDLGLVIIDEEQRFGVKHKEVFKQMRSTVDVLSMSATPIPRTLYLALTGARDLSVIETAPTNRHPIQTVVKTYDEKLVIDAVRHELRRGGQVFYLHNRIETINLVAARLRELMPDVTIGVGHGQMEAADLEEVMTEFVAGRYQLLVCTTIIESGLDIPNCNTILIEGADRFGLSQLYQLRGRVGRFKHQAYAYLLLHRHTRLLDVARQRLTAMRQHTQLGAGFRIAMRDLELRGAGNLLGAQQSGHIVGVGFELYCQLLRQSVARLKGEKTAAAIRASVKLDFVIVGEAEGRAGPPLPAGKAKDAPATAPAASGIAALPSSARGRHQDGYTALRDAEDAQVAELPKIQARLPAAYIPETRLRIDFYRKLAMADSPAKLKEIEAALQDRFGKIGPDVRALLLTTQIRILAEQTNILSVETEANRLKCLRNSGRRDDWVQVGTRFPRLTASTPLLRLKEIIAFLHNLPSPPST